MTTFIDGVAQVSYNKNAIINGAMDIWQRGTTVALTATLDYMADRWCSCQATPAGIQARVASGLAGFTYALKIGRTVSNTGTTDIKTAQIIESWNVTKLQGQAVTLSWYAKAGANFSAASSNMKIYASYGTTADEGRVKFLAGTWAGITVLENNVTQTITTSWVRYSITFTVGAAALELGVQFSYTPVGTAGADDNLYITGVQLELGSVATPFEFRHYGQELALCQRYCIYFQGTSAYARYLLGAADTTNTGVGFISLPVEMRVVPAQTNSATSTFAFGGVEPSGSFAIGYSTTKLYAPNFTVAGTPFTVAHAYELRDAGSNNSWILLSSEL